MKKCKIINVKNDLNMDLQEYIRSKKIIIIEDNLSKSTPIKDATKIMYELIMEDMKNNK